MGFYKRLKIVFVLLFVLATTLFKSCCKSTDEYFDLPNDELIIFNDGDTIMYSSNKYEYKDTFKIKVKLYYVSNTKDCDFCYCSEHYQLQDVYYYELADSIEKIGSLSHYYNNVIHDIFRFKGFVANIDEGILLPEFTINDMTYKNVTVYSNTDSITIDSMVIRKFWHNYQYGIICYEYDNGDIYGINL